MPANRSNSCWPCSALVSAEFKVGLDQRGCAFANAAIELPDPTHPARRVIEEAKSRYRQLIVDGARAHALPAEWCAWLERLPAR